MVCSFLLLSFVYRTDTHKKRKEKDDDDIFNATMRVLRRIYEARARAPSVYIQR